MYVCDILVFKITAMLACKNVEQFDFVMNQCRVFYFTTKNFHYGITMLSKALNYYFFTFYIFIFWVPEFWLKSFYNYTLSFKVQNSF